MKRKQIILMCGIPASGKSTKGLQLAEDNDMAYVNRDFIHEMFSLGYTNNEQKLTKKMFVNFIEASLINGESVVADATHLNEGSRLPIIEVGKKYGADIIAIYMKTSYETCVLRNAAREVPVPKEMMHNMNRIMRAPQREEGFKNVYVYKEGEEYKWA